MPPDGPGASPPTVWPMPDGTPVACREKLKVLGENHREAAQVLRDAFEGAVLEIHQRQRRQIDGDVAERNPLCSRNLGGGQEQRAPGPARAQA